MMNKWQEKTDMEHISDSLMWRIVWSRDHRDDSRRRQLKNWQPAGGLTLIWNGSNRKKIGICVCSYSIYLTAHLLCSRFKTMSIWHLTPHASLFFSHRSHFVISIVKQRLHMAHFNLLHHWWCIFTWPKMSLGNIAFACFDFDPHYLDICIKL